MNGQGAQKVAFFDLSRKITRHRDLIDKAIERVLNSGQVVLGKECLNFETEFAKYIGVQNCVGVASGSDAIEIALRATGITAGMKVATSANAGNYASTSISAISAATIYMDVDFATRNITLDATRKAIAQGADAIIATHLYGLAISEIAEISQLCSDNSVILIEDCAQAHGALVNGKAVGSFGDASAFSFYPTKNLGALGEAGAVLTNNEEVAARAQKLRTYGWGDKYSVVLPGGRNSRLDEIQAAILHDLLPYLDGDNARRRDIADAYSAAIVNPSIDLPKYSGSEYVAHHFVITSDARAGLISQLDEAGISTAIHFPIADHRQPSSLSATNVSLPITEKLSAQVLSLPCYPYLLDDEIDLVISAINRIS